MLGKKFIDEQRAKLATPMDKLGLALSVLTGAIGMLAIAIIILAIRLAVK